MCEVPLLPRTLNTDTDTFLTAQGRTCYGGCSQDCVKVNPDTQTVLCAPRGAALIQGITQIEKERGEKSGRVPPGCIRRASSLCDSFWSNLCERWVSCPLPASCEGTALWLWGGRRVCVCTCRQFLRWECRVGGSHSNPLCPVSTYTHKTSWVVQSQSMATLEERKPGRRVWERERE